MEEPNELSADETRIRLGCCLMARGLVFRWTASGARKESKVATAGPLYHGCVAPRHSRCARKRTDPAITESAYFHAPGQEWVKDSDGPQHYYYECIESRSVSIQRWTNRHAYPVGARSRRGNRR